MHIEKDNFGADMPLIKPGPDGGHLSSSERSNDFTVLFYGGSGFKDGEEEALRRAAHKELYTERMGRAPPKGASNAALRQEIEQAAGKPVNIRLVVLRIDEDDRAGSFIQQMGNLEKFLNKSRDRFLADTIDELKTLGAVKSKAGEKVSKDKFKLCLALLEAERKDKADGSGFFDGKNTAALKELRTSEELKYLFRNVESALLKGRGEQDAAGGAETKFSYHGKGADADRGQSPRDRSRESASRA